MDAKSMWYISTITGRSSGSWRWQRSASVAMASGACSGTRNGDRLRCAGRSPVLSSHRMVPKDQISLAVPQVSLRSCPGKAHATVPTCMGLQKHTHHP